jgi:hypothetical protein
VSPKAWQRLELAVAVALSLGRHVTVAEALKTTNEQIA